MNHQDQDYLVDGKYGIANLVDLDELRDLFQKFTQAAGFTIGFLDHPGLNILIDTGWQDICTKFHRSHPQSEAICLRSNRHLLDPLDIPGKLAIELCGNGLVDCAMPVIIQGKHIASLVTGQLLLESPDIEKFKQQARQYGFAEKEYLQALQDIEVIDGDHLKTITAFLGSMAQLISQMGYTKLMALEDAERAAAEIARRKHAEEALRYSEARLSMALAVGSAGIWEWDLKRDEVHFDAQFHAILGYQPGELPSTMREWGPYHHPEEFPLMVSKVEAYLRGDNPIYESEHRIRTKAGTWAWVFTRGQIVNLTNTESRDHFMGIAINITGRKQAEEELTQYREHLEELVAIRTAELSASNRELEAFSYSVSHDLRAPLRSLDGFSLALLEDYADQLNSEGKEHLSRIRSASRRMGDLIDDLLKLSQISRTELHIEAVNLSELAQSIANRLQQSQPERQIEIAIQDEMVVQGDKRLLSIALENLIDNAWKFTSHEPRGKIEFGTNREDDGMIYFVRDNGIGFDMKHTEKLFGPFQRLHSAKDYPGTGIGLSTVQRIVQRHGGQVWAQAETGKGAAFYFKL
jgi:PAS domain S-box-containing protein